MGQNMTQFIQSQITKVLNIVLQRVLSYLMMERN
jgi:hypothetical protein